MRSFEYLKFAQGFTLIELLIVITIIGTLTLAVIPMISSFQSDQSLANAAQEMKTAFSVAKSNAANGVTCGDNNRAIDWHFIPGGTIKYFTAPNCESGTGTGKEYNLPDNIYIKYLYLITPNLSNSPDDDSTFTC